ncbi:MAG: hypothetical protein U5J78_06760 [Parasphingorhabdus sp.]|nr:hypothetical protein [Parasphingorhabdus sp.]
MHRVLIPLSLGVAAPAIAQETPVGNLTPTLSDGRQVYEVAKFDRFAPRTALDMVTQIPGFTISDVDNNRRGLGQATQNVLINGQRISGKNEDAFTVLGRINRTNVVRLEIVDGATLAISGLSGQVLNVVTKDGGLQGTFVWRPIIRRGPNAYAAGEVTLTGPVAGGNFTLSLENDPSRNIGSGLENVFDRNGAVLFRRDEQAIARSEAPKLTASFARTAANGNILNVRSAYQINRFRESVDTRRFAPATADIGEQFRGRQNSWNFEGSGDYEFALGAGRLKLIGLQRLEHAPFSETFIQSFTDGRPAIGNRFDRTSDESESILRGEYRWKGGKNDWSVSIEGAYNSLDNVGMLFELDNLGIFQPVPVANTDGKVEEKRGEAILSYGRPLASNLTLQSTLGGEYSVISQTGPNAQSRSFIRPKASVSLAWKLSPTADLSLRLAREVGQLDFFDFVASVDVNSNANNAGNPQLVPPQSWKAELELTKKLGLWGSGTVTIYGEKISDIVDAIPISPTEEALGNLPSATSFGVKLVSSTLFDPIGWKGAKLDFEGEVRRTRIRDPLLGNFRPISFDLDYRFNLSLRHDIPGTQWAYGGGLELYQETGLFRLDQTARFLPDRPYSRVFVEHKNVFGLTVQARVDNLNNVRERFVRTFYVDRRDGPVDFIESRSRTFGRIYRFTVSGSF